MRVRLEDDKEIDRFVGERVRNYREFLGLSRKEIAEAFSVTEDTVYRIEAGTNGLSGTYGFVLATKFNFDMEYVFGKKETLENVEVDCTSLGDQEIINRAMFYMKMLKERQKKVAE